jgi:hypothetical protein
MDIVGRVQCSIALDTNRIEIVLQVTSHVQACEDDK